MNLPNPSKSFACFHLWPRGRLDIGWQELAYAAMAVFFSGVHARKVWPTSEPHLAMQSVRTAWDALLAVENWPQGSEVIFSEANIPAMTRIMEAHGLLPVPASLDPHTLALNESEVESLITPRTRAILVSPLFGSRMPLTELGCNELVDRAAEAASSRDFALAATTPSHGCFSFWEGTNRARARGFAPFTRRFGARRGPPHFLGFAGAR